MEDQSDTNFIPSVEFVKAFQRFVGEVFRLNGQLLSTADMLSKDLEVSTARWQTIAAIRNEPLSVAAIARRLGLSRQSVQQTVNRLEKQDIVEFTENPDHRTSPLVQLTDRGEEIMETLRERQTRLTAYFTRDLGYSAEEVEQLSQQLRDMRAHADRIGLLEAAKRQD